MGRLNAVVDGFLVPLFAGVGWLQLALVSLVAGVGEELFFRGVLQPTLIGWIGIAAGLIAASVVFGLLHAITPTYALLATAVGAYLGWLARGQRQSVGTDDHPRRLRFRCTGVSDATIRGSRRNIAYRERYRRLAICCRIEYNQTDLNWFGIEPRDLPCPQVDLTDRWSAPATAAGGFRKATSRGCALMG